MPDTENLTRSEAAERSALLTVRTYDVHVDLSSAASQEAETYPVTTRIEFDCSRPGSSSFVDYLGESVESVVLNGNQLNLQENVGPARIQLPGLQESNVAEFRSTSKFSRSGEGLHRFSDPEDGSVYLYTQYEPADSRRVFPVFEQPDLKARFRFSIIGPEDWELRSNSAEVSRDQVGTAADRLVKVSFAETPPMSSYITALLAGPYHRVEGHWTGSTPSGQQVEVPLAVMCRSSLAEHFDAENLLELTRRGLDFFHSEFDYPYPWGKYDQVFVPEYNLGAMENPGLVTFTEQYVFDTAATDSQYETRANTLMHEMAHMWFGDLVTMYWWDDLWLKESFADYMGSLAVDEATDWTTSWVSFANSRKGWAYVQDQLPTTHPVVADIEDLEAADQNFDGITYAKGASVLKQLAAYAGRDAFRTASRRYFARHAFANASLDDFLTILEEATGKDMRAWAQAWLQTSGLPLISTELPGLIESDTAPGASGTPAGEATEAELESTDDEVIVVQSGKDPVTGEAVQRPHVIEVGIYVLDREASELRLSSSHPVEIDAEAAHGRTPVPGLQLPKAGTTRLLLPNEKDLTYTKLSLDPDSVAAVLRYPVGDPLARATVWAALWSMVRDGELSSREFLRAVMGLGLDIDEISVVQTLLRQANQALLLYTPAAARPELETQFAARLAEFIAESDGNPSRADHQRAAARTLASLSHRHGTQLQLLSELLADRGDEFGISSLAIDEEVRWAFLQALAAHGQAGVKEINAELERKTTARAKIAHRLAMAARPEKTVKELAFGQALSGADEKGDELSNDHLSATVEGFRADTTSHASLITPYQGPYFDALEEVWHRMSQGQATRVIGGLFPGVQVLDSGQTPEEHPVARMTQSWLDEHEDAPAALRRIILEEQDHLLRSLRVQAWNAQ